MKILDLFLRTLRETLYLFGSKTYSPEDTIISFGLKGQIKYLQTLRIFEATQIRFLARLDESHRLSKHLHKQAGPASLFPQRG